MKFSPEIKYLSNQDSSCIHLGWSMPFVRPVTSWLSGFRSCSRYEHGWCCRDFWETCLIQIEVVYQGRLRKKQGVFANLHRLESSFSAGWVLEVPQSTGANHKEFSCQQGFSFCPAVVPFSRRLLTECSCVWDKKENQGVRGERSGGRVSDGVSDIIIITVDACSCTRRAPTGLRLEECYSKRTRCDSRAESYKVVKWSACLPWSYQNTMYSLKSLKALRCWG